MQRSRLNFSDEDLSGGYLFYIQSLPFFLAVFCPFIGRVALYTPSSRPKSASIIKAKLECHKSSDDFNTSLRTRKQRNHEKEHVPVYPRG